MITVNDIFKVVAGVFLCLLLPSCHVARERAIDVMKKAFAERRARSMRSMELCRKGLDAQNGGEISLARKYLNDAIEQDDRNAYAWMALGIIKFEQNELHEAARAFRRASRLQPNRYEPLFNIGTVFEAAGNYSQAIKKYEAALKLAPNRVEVMENLARCHIETGAKLDEATELIARALKFERRPEWIQWLQQQLQDLKRKYGD